MISSLKDVHLSHPVKTMEFEWSPWKRGRLENNDFVLLFYDMRPYFICDKHVSKEPACNPQDAYQT